jgi:hypothetical protein
LGSVGDLGFSYQTRRLDEIVISRHGVPVATLHGDAAKKFKSRRGDGDTQQLMARVTATTSGETSVVRESEPG